MSGLGKLLKAAEVVQRRESDDHLRAALSGDRGKNVAAANWCAARAAVHFYLEAVADTLAETGTPQRAIEPLLWLKDQLDSIDSFGAEPDLFRGGMPCLSKPVQRLYAEGHAVGCVTYLREAVGFGVMDACGAVASLFSCLGHAGRSAKGKLGAADRLSSKTLHQWCTELERKPEDVNLAWTLRWSAKLSAIEALHEAERRDPTSDLPQQDARKKIAERMGNIAVQTLVGAPDGPGWRFEHNSESTR